MKLILKYLNRYKGLVLLNIIGVLGFALVELGIPTIMATVIDKGIAYNDISYIKKMGTVIVIISVLGVMGSILLGFTSAKISTSVVRDIRNDIFKKSQEFSHSEYDRFGISSMITRTTNDAFQVMQFTNTILRMAMICPIMFIISVFLILSTSVRLSAILSVTLPLIVLGLPIFDTLWAIIRRLIKGKSIKAIFKADKGHLHHRIVAKGFSQKQAVLILYGISAIFGIFAVILLDSGIWKALSFLLMVIVAIGLGYRNFQEEHSDEENQRYECIECKYIYNPKFGNEKAGIKPGTQFEDLPDNWVCPVCGEGKDMFQELHQ